MSGVAIDQDGVAKAGMGVHAADLDADGDNDLIVMNLDAESDSYYRNDGKYFTDATASVGLRVASRRFTRFGVGFHDFDTRGAGNGRLARIDLDAPHTAAALGQRARHDARTAAHVQDRCARRHRKHRECVRAVEIGEIYGR